MYIHMYIYIYTYKCTFPMGVYFGHLGHGFNLEPTQDFVVRTQDSRGFATELLFNLVGGFKYAVNNIFGMMVPNDFHVLQRVLKPPASKLSWLTLNLSNIVVLASFRTAHTVLSSKIRIISLSDPIILMYPVILVKTP